MGTRMLRIPKASKLPIGTVICAAIVTLLVFINFGVNHGIFYFEFSLAAYFTNFENVVIFLLRLPAPLLLLLFALMFSKKNIKLLLIPFIFCLLAFIITVAINVSSRLYNLSSVNWFFPICYATVLFLFALTIQNVISNKYVLVTACLVIIAVALILTLLHSNVFTFFRKPDTYRDGSIDYNEYIFLSSLISFIAYIAGIAFIAFALDNDPNKEYYENAIVERPAYYTGLNGEVTQSVAAQGLRAQYSNIGSPVQNPSYSTPLNVAVNDPVERIKELHALKEQGVLSDEEFEAKKRELLSRI